MVTNCTMLHDSQRQIPKSLDNIKIYFQGTDRVFEQSGKALYTKPTTGTHATGQLIQSPPHGSSLTCRIER